MMFYEKGQSSKERRIDDRRLDIRRSIRIMYNSIKGPGDAHCNIIY
jgi:exosome complex RNA-binding protein Rrp42 (RNase PH superfamily)